MKMKFALGSKTYCADVGYPLDISIPLYFNAVHPVCWGAPVATASIYTAEGFVGDTRQGGSCNVEEYRFIPHCQGTHTECVGHIAHGKIEINQLLQDAFIPCTLISVQPQLAMEIEDQYWPDKQNGDLMISEEALREKLATANPDFLAGLIIRTLPNEREKTSRDYLRQSPPFLSLNAIEYLVSLSVKHLLVDIPSVDRVFDEGYLSVHRLFWNVPPKEHNIDLNQCSANTISEMIYVPNEIPDGSYLLNLQIPAFATDAAPSRPLLYPLCD